MTTFTTAAIEADPKLPIIRITRDFAATPQQLLRAHTDPDLFARWCGPDAGKIRIEEWDARTSGRRGRGRCAPATAAAGSRRSRA